MTELLSLIFIVGSIQAFFLSIFLLAWKQNKTANKVLGVLMITVSLSMLHGYLMIKELYMFAPHILFLSDPMLFLFGPMLLLYVKYITSNDDRFNLKDLLHLIPFLLVIIYLTIFYYSKSGSEKLAIFSLIGGDKSISDFTVIHGIGELYGVLYSILCLIKVSRYEKKITKFFSNVDKVELSWLKKLILFSIVIYTVSNFSFFATLFLSSKFDVLQGVGTFIAVILLYIIAYLALKQSEIFELKEDMNSALPDEDDDNVERYSKYKKIQIDEEKQIALLKMLEKYMEDEKPYIDSMLTLGDLAKFLTIPPSHLSMIFSSQTEYNFFTFVNRYRVEEIVKIFKDPEHADKTILSIAYANGFNSKSTFNNMFKKFKGVTPSIYRKSLTSEG